MSVQNTLQGILSPKVVQSGSGYAAKVDIQNVDTITCSKIQGSVSFIGSNCGKATILPNDGFVVVDNENIRPDSIILVTATYLRGSSNNVYVDATHGQFKINITYTDTSNTVFNYFIAKY